MAAVGGDAINHVWRNAGRGIGLVGALVADAARIIRKAADWVGDRHSRCDATCGLSGTAAIILAIGATGNRRISANGGFIVGH